ncbi:MAG: precorrin-8X methylmutase, partial [Candidatus Omnitrophota bacterium]
MLIKPKEIEKKSFAIIGAYLRRFGMPRKKRAVVARVIHASADLAYARGLVFSPRAIEQGLAAINAGQDIIVDSTMVKAGISDLVRDRFSCRVVCLLKDKGVAATAQRAGITRCAAAMQKAGGIMHGAIVVVGNAPTALFEVCRLIKQGRVRPCLVI